MTGLPATRRWRRAGLTLLACAGLLLLLRVGLRDVSWAEMVAGLRAARPGWVLAAVGLNLLALVFWALAWRCFLPSGTRASTRRMFQVAAHSALLMNTAPAGVGHGSAFLLLQRVAGASRAGAMAVLALDQLAEGMAKLALAALAALLLPLPGWLHRSLLVLLVGIAGLLAVLLRVARAHAGPHATGIRAALARWAASLEALRGGSRFVGGLAMLLALKSVEVLAILAVQRALGLQIPLAAAVLALVAVQVATAVPVVPGSLGQYEAAAFAAYRYAGVPAGDAAQLALLQHLCFLVPMIGTGLALLALRGLRLPRARRPAPEAAT